MWGTIAQLVGGALWGNRRRVKKAVFGKPRAKWDKLSHDKKVMLLDRVGVGYFTGNIYAGTKWRYIPKHMQVVARAAMRGKPVSASAVKKALR